MESPISDGALERLAHRVADALRRVVKRAPREVKRDVRAVLDGVFRVVQTQAADPAPRVRLARELERLDAELRGRQAFVAEFYCEGRLGLVRAYDPIRIRGAVDHRWVARHHRRYESRVLKNEARLNWFYRRVGLEVEAAPGKKPWELPYAGLEGDKELLWGKKGGGS